MAPQETHHIRPTSPLYEDDTEEVSAAPKISRTKERKFEPAWRNIFILLFLHVNAFYGLYLLLTGKAMWQTVLFCKLIKAKLNFTAVKILFTPSLFSLDCNRLWTRSWCSSTLVTSSLQSEMAIKTYSHDPQHSCFPSINFYLES